MKDHDIAALVNHVTDKVKAIFPKAPQSLREVIAKAVKNSLDTAPSKKYTEGFYTLASPNEQEPVLVHGYFCTDEGGEFVFGFNTHDGGGYVPASHLPSDTIVQKMMVIKENA